MSIQANKYDGVHLDLRGNLIKAMAIVNWLAMIDVEGWSKHACEELSVVI